MRRRLPIIGAAAVVYLVALLLIGLWPSHVDQNLNMTDRPPVTWMVDLFGLTPAQGYDIGEFLANVLLFLPAGALALAVLPRLGWWRVVAAFAVFSIGIELAQTYLRPGRTGDVGDVVANTLGAAIGATLTWLLMARRTRERSSLSR